jgi:hypothetical protein
MRIAARLRAQPRRMPAGKPSRDAARVGTELHNNFTSAAPALAEHMERIPRPPPSGPFQPVGAMAATCARSGGARRPGYRLAT